MFWIPATLLLIGGGAILLPKILKTSVPPPTVLSIREIAELGDNVYVDASRYPAVVNWLMSLNRINPSLRPEERITELGIHILSAPPGGIFRGAITGYNYRGPSSSGGSSFGMTIQNEYDFTRDSIVALNGRRG